MLQVFYELTPNVYTEMHTVRYKGFQVGCTAAAGQANTGKIPFDDPGGTLTIKGWRKVRVYETEATPTLLWSGRIRNKTVKRGDSDRPSLRTGADRWWDCDAIDQNTLMGARVIRGTSANRPAETAGERLAWLLSTSFTIYVDNGHVTYPSNALDPNDYTGQTAADVIADCATPGGYNYFALQVDDTDFPELFFMLPDDADWNSDLSLSDDPSDVDLTTVFPPSYDAELSIVDEIVAAGVFLPYSGGTEQAYVYVDDSDIGDEFAYVDKTAPMANVKTSAKATVIANRHLALSGTEAEKITCWVDLPASLANAIRPWHRISYKSTWMPNFSEYRECRVIDWSIEQRPYHGGGDGYRVHLELSPIDATPPVVGDNWFIAYQGASGGTNQVGYKGITVNGVFIPNIADMPVPVPPQIGGEVVYYFRTGGFGWNFGQTIGDYDFPLGGDVGNTLIMGPFDSGDEITFHSANASATYPQFADARYRIAEWSGPIMSGVPQSSAGTIGADIATNVLAGVDTDWTVP
jgi:hypothetical protein